MRQSTSGNKMTRKIIFLVVVATLQFGSGGLAFSTPSKTKVPFLPTSTTKSTKLSRRRHHNVGGEHQCLCAMNDDEEGDMAAAPSERVGMQDPFSNEPRIIYQGSVDDNLTDEEWEAMEKERTPTWEWMQLVMGINGFTYFLAFLAFSFVALNQILGPGWLGQALGVKGVGTLPTGLGQSVPDTVDLNSSPDFLLR